MTLAEYIRDVRLILHDPFGNFYTTSDITLWVNKARKQVAMEGQCVRILTPSSSFLTSITVTAPGVGYATATVTISGPDAFGQGWTQATATATINAGQITAITITNPGTGYVAVPIITIEGDGTGAEATATLGPHLTANLYQEKYQLADAYAVIASMYPGVGPISGIQSVGVCWGAMRPVLDNMDFSALQAYARSWGQNIQSWPRAWAQYGQGQTGSMYLWPTPSQLMEMEWDCYCTVLDLSDMQPVDAIPQPFAEAVQYYAAYHAYLNSQRLQDAQAQLSLYRSKMNDARAFVTPAVIPTMYPGL